MLDASEYLSMTRIGIPSSNPSLPRALADDGAERLADDFQVEQPAAVLDVLNVILDPFLEIRACAARAPHLPKARDSGANAQPRFAPRRAELVFAVRAWPRADDRHVPDQHVPELRQL